MSHSPAKPRQFSVPMQSKSTGIPTPGRLRSPSTTHIPLSLPDNDTMNAAFADAIKANDPAAHRPIQPHNTGPASYSHHPQSGRRSVVGRPPSVASSSSAAASIPFRAIPPRSKTPTTRPASRQSAAFDKGPARPDRSFDVGDNVRIESLGFEGTLRFIGEIDGKSGQWAGVELGGGFAGKGKNDGSVNK